MRRSQEANHQKDKGYGTDVLETVEWKEDGVKAADRDGEERVGIFGETKQVITCEF